MDAVLDQRPNVEFSEVFSKPVTVIALVRREDAQLARVLAGELLTDLCITPFPRRSTVQIENRLRLCIDELRHFHRLNAVVCPSAVVATCTGAVEVRCVDRADLTGLVQLR